MHVSIGRQVHSPRSLTGNHITMQSPGHYDSVVLVTRDLGKRYPNGHWGLRHATVSLQRGRMVAVLGPNGAGKSTLIHMLAGAIRPTEGEITLADPSLRTGWSSQRTTIDWYLNTRQNIEIGGRLYGLSRAESRERALSLMERFRLTELANNDVSMLSGGQQQRIQVARTLMSDPDFMLLDEPTAALDVESSEDVLGYIRERTRAGALALVSSHDLGLLERYCDEVMFILNGEIVAHQSMTDFLNRFTPSDSITLTLESDVSERILHALHAYAPTPDAEDPRAVTVSLPDGGALGDIVIALNGVARVINVSRTPASLRHVYLNLTNQEAS